MQELILQPNTSIVLPPGDVIVAGDEPLRIRVDMEGLVSGNGGKTLPTGVIAKLKIELREKQIPFFDDEEILYRLEKNKNDFNATAYEMLLIKAENSTIAVSGMTTQDTSAYFRRLASRFRSFSSGQLSGS